MRAFNRYIIYNWERKPITSAPKLRYRVCGARRKIHDFYSDTHAFECVDTFAANRSWIFGNVHIYHQKLRVTAIFDEIVTEKLEMLRGVDA